MKGVINKGGVKRREVLERLDNVNEWVGRITSYIILAIMGIIVFEVVSRYVFDAPTVWAHDLTGYVLFSYIILGGGYCLLYRGHVGIDIVYNRLSPKRRLLIDLTYASIIFFIFTSVLLWKGTEFALTSLAIRETARTGLWSGPVYPFKMLFPVGALLIMFQWVLNLIRDIGAVKNKH